MRSLRVVVPLAVLVLLAAVAASASAVTMHLPGGKVVSYLPVPADRAQGQQRVHSFDEAFTNLDYNGGPVMSSNTDYALYWRPSTATAYPGDYKSGVNAYFKALEHDSGGHQNADSVAAQYNDASGQFANYDVKFGGELIDEDPYPASGCTRAPICLTDEQIQAEILNFVTKEKLPTGLGVEYFLLTPEGVESCFEGGAAEVCSANSEEPFYCAYHLNIPLGGGGVLLYANDPFVNNKNCDKPADHINGSSDSALFGGLSHEHLETVTDPEPNNAWTDYMTGEENGYEVADKCNSNNEAFEFGTPLGKVEVSGKQVPYNQEIDGRKYYIQQEWSNQGHKCMQRFTFSGAEPTASFTAKVGTPKTDIALDASASTATGGVSAYSWSFNSGEGQFEVEEPGVLVEFPPSGQYRVALTVFGPDGTSIGAARTLTVGGFGPSASIGFSASPTAGHPVSFDGSGSSDPSGSITSYEWSFGDGSAGTGASPSHTYATAGSYLVTLTVTGSDGLNARTTRLVSVSADGGGVTPPTPVTPQPLIVSSTPPVAAPGPTASTANSSFTTKLSTNAKTGAIALTVAVLDPGKLSWGATFANGKFGAFASSSKCKKGQISIRGRCLPAKITFAKGSRTLAAAGSVVITLKPSASALKALKTALKQKKGVPISIALSFQSSRGGAAVTHAQTVTVKLKK